MVDINQFNPEKFRTHMQNPLLLFLAGRTDQNNEKLVKQAKPNQLLFHTVSAGSPFLNIKGDYKKEDIYDAATMCARYSREWKKSKSDIAVHYFFKKDTFKRKDMKPGTFGVKKSKTIIVKKEDLLYFSTRPAKKADFIRLKEHEII